MANWKEKRKNPKWGKCEKCEETFDWRYHGLVTGSGMELCGYECYKRVLDSLTVPATGITDWDSI